MQFLMISFAKHIKEWIVPSILASMECWHLRKAREATALQRETNLEYSNISSNLFFINLVYVIHTSESEYELYC